MELKLKKEHYYSTIPVSSKAMICRDSTKLVLLNFRKIPWKTSMQKFVS